MPQAPLITVNVVLTGASISLQPPVDDVRAQLATAVNALVTAPGTALGTWPPPPHAATLTPAQLCSLDVAAMPTVQAAAAAVLESFQPVHVRIVSPLVYAWLLLLFTDHSKIAHAVCLCFVVCFDMYDENNTGAPA